MFDYETLFNDIGCLNCTEQQLHSLKSNYREQINSKRRFDSIRTLPQLLKVLENRDYISYDSYQPLVEIAQLLQPSFFHQNRSSWNGAFAFQLPSKGLLIQDYNILCSSKYFFVASPLRPISNGPGPSLQRTVPLDRARYRIATSIGQKWQDFARALKVPEGVIDELARSTMPPMDRVYQVIDYHHQNCYDQREFEISLLEALGEARRNDLRVLVQNILYH